MLCRYFGSLEYDWRGLSEQPTVLAKAKRSIAQLGPKEYERFQWRAFSSPLRCLECLGPLVLILLFEVRHCKSILLQLSHRPGTVEFHTQRLPLTPALPGVPGTPGFHFAV